jgi:large subunit ribosomal protein L17
MRHGLSGRQLNRNASHRDALWHNLVTALFTYGRIETTEAKAKELRKHADAAIKWGIQVADVIKKGDKATPAEKALVVHTKRQARKVLKTDAAMNRLFGEIGQHFKARSGSAKGGYTRVLKTRFRRGDAASMAFVELVGLEPAIS